MVQSSLDRLVLNLKKCEQQFDILLVASSTYIKIQTLTNEINIHVEMPLIITISLSRPTRKSRNNSNETSYGCKCYMIDEIRASRYTYCVNANIPINVKK